MRFLQRANQRPAWGFSLKRYLLALDWILLLATFGLVAFGMLMIYSATHADPGLSSSTYYVKAQLLGFALGLVLMVALSLVDFGWYANHQRYIYGAMLFLLVLTLIIGSGPAGARRWIELPFFDLQTSELAKALMIVSLAVLLAEAVELRSRFRFILLTVVYTAAPAILVFLQPDLGTSLVFVIILMSMLFVWGARWTHLGALVAGGLAAVVMVLRVLPATFGVSVLKTYQVQRLWVFLDPEHDSSTWGYQLLQSKISVGSGMFAGKGFMEGTQTHLNFLPAHHTDFIFAVIGEELGFIGAAVLLCLYLVVIWRIFRIAGRSKNLLGTLIATGVGATLLFQVFVNVGMTIGIMPITGIPLPFVSYGGSSLVVFLVAVGLLQSVHVHSTTSLYGGRLKGEPYGQMAT